MAYERTILHSPRLPDPDGWARAVEVRGASLVWVSGVAPMALDGSGVEGAGDMAAQAHAVFRNLGLLLEGNDLAWEDTVSIRVYLTDMSQWSTVDRARKQAMGEVLVAMTGAEVSALAHPDFLIEAEAVVARPIDGATA